MVRNYKPDPHGKTYKKYAPEDMEKAITAVKNGLSYRKASAKFGIPTTVLHRHKVHGKKILKQGGQTFLPPEVETILVKKLIIMSEWGSPCSLLDLRYIVKSYLDKRGIPPTKFKNNLPGHDFTKLFIRRHAKELSERMCQNIKRTRAGVSPTEFEEYFAHLKVTLEGVPSSNILNFDETNLADDPGRKKIICKRGCKYPERIINHSKSANSIMCCASADGQLLPMYVVYKSKSYMYTTWTIGGPSGCRYNRSISGWFDSACFEDWIASILIPYCRKLTGRKVLIGDNLSSHLTIDVVRMCKENNIDLVFLPANSTHLSQPLDVAFFRPFKIAWRKILQEYKTGPGRKECGIPKDVFPRLLQKLISSIQENQKQNILSGFAKCGIQPFNPQKLLERLPSLDEDNADIVLDDDMNQTLVQYLRNLRYSDMPKKKTPRKRVATIPGKSVSEENVVNNDNNEDLNNSQNIVENETEVCDISENEDCFNSNNDSDKQSVVSCEDATRNYENEENLNMFFISYNGKMLYGVTDVTHIQIDDWLVVDFNNFTSSKPRSLKRSLYIGQVVSQNKERVLGNFVKYTPTLINKGSIFIWPNIKDEAEFPLTSVVGKVSPPIQLRRGQLKFEVNVEEW